MPNLATPKDQIQETTATGAAAISTSTPSNARYKILKVTLAFDTAPTTSENFTLTLNSVQGADYDVVVLTNDPSVGSNTSVVWYPDPELVLLPGDTLDAAYDNTDTRTYGLVIQREEF